MSNRVSKSNSMSNRVSKSNSGVGNSYGGSYRVLGNTLIGNISNIAINIVGVVVDSLGPSVRESNGVGALFVSKTVRGLSSLEVGARVVISHSIVVGVGGDLGQRISTSNSNRVGNGVSNRVGNGVSNRVSHY